MRGIWLATPPAALAFAPGILLPPGDLSCTPLPPAVATSATTSFPPCPGTGRPSLALYADGGRRGGGGRGGGRRKPRSGARRKREAAAPRAKRGGRKKDSPTLASLLVPEKKRKLPASRVVILPDFHADLSNPRLWHHKLKDQVVEYVDMAAYDLAVSIDGMPDPYAFNTKRYESLWVRYMEQELGLDEHTLVVAHGTAADAVLRYLETHKLAGVVLVACGGDTYHAGERHGRPYVWEVIKRSCEFLAVVHGEEDPLVGPEEARRVKEGLGVQDVLFRVANGGQDRFKTREKGLREVWGMLDKWIFLSVLGDSVFESSSAVS